MAVAISAYILAIVSIVGGLCLTYRMGYNAKARRVLEERLNWLKVDYRDLCPCGNDWDDCPDCRH